jgi:hypothetical protein
MPREGNCVRMGQGFGGFLGLCEKVFSLTTMPGVAYPSRSSFFFKILQECSLFGCKIYEFSLKALAKYCAKATASWALKEMNGPARMALRIGIYNSNTT